MRLALEAYGNGDLRERDTRFGQYRLRSLDTMVKEEIVRTVSGRRAKLRREMHSRQAGYLGEVGEAYALVKVPGDIFLHPR